MRRPAYRIEYAERVVKIRAVGRKDRSRVLIGGEEVELR